MEHWFDGFVKELASEDPSRRTFLGGIFATFGAAVSGVVPGAGGFALAVPGQANATQPAASSDKRGSCTLERNGTASTVRHSVQSTFNGKALTHTVDLTLTRAGQRGQAPHITSTRTIRLGSDSLIQIDKDSQGGMTQVKLTYGAAFQGVREVSYTTDGKTIDGMIDGRSISPFSAGADPKSIKFADGGAPPAVKLDAALGTAVDAILKRAQDDISSCTGGRSGLAPDQGHGNTEFAMNGDLATGWISSFTSRSKAFSALAVPLASFSPAFLSSFFLPEVAAAAKGSLAAAGFPADPGAGGGGQDTIPQNSSGCQSCQNSCAYTATVCDAGACTASIACLFAWGACCAASLAACSVAAGVCVSNCDSPGTPSQPGGACCPVGCPNVDGCCYQNQQCSGTANICCAENVIVCNGNCCSPGDTCCGNHCCPAGNVCKDGVCCPPKRDICHGVCCAEGQVCSSEGICCKQLAFNTQPVSCGGACCAEGSKCAKAYPGAKDEVCCFTERICGGVCCQAGCVNGNECAPLCLVGEPCGSSCCEWGCADARTGTCKPAQKCAKGQSVCPGEAAGVVNVCCPTGTGCHNAKCCPTNTVYCSNVTTGVAGCWPQSQCYVAPPPK